MNPGLLMKVELREFGKSKCEDIIHVENRCSKKRETESIPASDPSLERKSYTHSLRYPHKPKVHHDACSHLSVFPYEVGKFL